MKIFSVNGYFNDDYQQFNGYLVTEAHQTPIGYIDSDIFFYGLSETQLLGTHDDFTITSYDIYDVTPREDITVKQRLEYLRQELRAERISYGELIELEKLAGYVQPGDVEPFEAADMAGF